MYPICHHRETPIVKFALFLTLSGVFTKKASVPSLSEKTFSLSFSVAGDLHPIAATAYVDHKLRLSDDVVANQINLVILNKSNKYLHKLKGIKIHVAFGCQLFSRFQVKIDYKHKIITLTELFATNCIHGFQSIPMSIHDTKPFINTQLSTKGKKSKKLNMMLDLGAKS